MPDRRHNNRRKADKTRVKTGIPGLDELVDGGLPKGSFTLVSGRCGTGKSIMAMQYLIKGITDYDEPGIFVSFERGTDAIARDMRQFGWRITTQQKQGNLRMLGGPLDEIMGFGEKAGAKPEDLIDEMAEVVEEMGAERLSVDGLGQFSMMFPDELSYRSGLAGLGRRLNELGCTSLMTSEVEEGKESLSRTGVEEFVADGVIVLHDVTESFERRRALEVRKMRASGHSNRMNFYEITSRGIVIGGGSRSSGGSWAPSVV